MAEYIEREKLQEALKRKRSTVTTQRYTDGWNDCLLRVKSMVHSAPAADVAPVRHARWIPEENGDVYFSCSYCGCEISTSWDYDDLEWNFCPECGCEMTSGTQPQREDV